MNIKLVNKFLYFNKYKIKCAIGKRGITGKKVEGDNKTPSGLFKFNTIFYLFLPATILHLLSNLASKAKISQMSLNGARKAVIDLRLS